MTTIEKISKALAVQWFCETGHDDADAVAAAESQWKGFESLARAALQAIREPTDATCFAIQDQGPIGCCSIHLDDARMIHTAMIDAILEEKPE